MIPNPVCSPGNHFLWTDLGIAKQSSCHARIAKQRARTLGARRKGRLNTEMFAKLKRQFTYRERFAPGDIQKLWRRFAQGKGPQAPGIRVALPNYVYLRHRQADRPSFEYGQSDVNQYSIAQLDGIIQTQKHNAGAPSCGRVLEHALATQRRISSPNDP